MPIFIVTVGEEKRLIDAPTKKAAIEHVVTAQKAKVYDILDLMEKGVEVEKVEG